MFRQYPLINGCGTVASSQLARMLVPSTDRTVWARVGKRQCLVPLNDLVGRAIYLVGELDRKVGLTLRRYVRPGDITLDVGANLGLVSLQFANASAGRILSFEPNPAILTLLEETLSVNTDSGIELHRVALGREDGQLTLTVPQGNAGRATLVSDQYTQSEQFTVQVKRLCDVLDQESVEAVDFMKLDVEGFEAEVIDGLFCGSIRPRYILFEDHRIADSETARRLRDEGYALFGLHAPHHIRLVEIAEDDPKFSLCSDFIAKRDM